MGGIIRNNLVGDRQPAGMAAVGLIHFKLLDSTAQVMIIGSFGASAVLIYGAIRSPLAQPRNLVGGHVLSALVGVTIYKLLGGQPWLAASVAVSLAIMLMHLTNTLHPPGGATALIAVIGGDAVHGLGYLYVLVPAGAGAVVMLCAWLLRMWTAPWLPRPSPCGAPRS